MVTLGESWFPLEVSKSKCQRSVILTKPTTHWPNKKAKLIQKYLLILFLFLLYNFKLPNLTSRKAYESLAIINYSGCEVRAATKYCQQIFGCRQRDKATTQRTTPSVFFEPTPISKICRTNTNSKMLGKEQIAACV